MRITYIFFIFFTFSIYCKSQYRADYRLTHKTAQKEFYADASLQIDLKANTSVFYLSQYKNLLKNKYELNEQGDTVKIIHNSAICRDNKEYFFDFTSNRIKELLYDVSCDSKVLIKGKINFPEWNIEKNQKKYKDWHVYEASAVINGRKWSVLFTEEYKINIFAPWKFIGLPGLVVYASDEMNEYFFELVKINENQNIAFKEPEFSKKSSFNKYIEKAISNNKRRMIKKISEEFNIPENEVDISNSPKYETLDFIEK